MLADTNTILTSTRQSHDIPAANHHNHGHGHGHVYFQQEQEQSRRRRRRSPSLRHPDPIPEQHDPVPTAKLSPIILNRNLHVPPSAYERTMGVDRTNRKRRSSSIVYHEPPESFEQLSDQAALPNLNAEWVNAKGAWLIHPILIFCLKILFDIVPGITQEVSWTLTNITYMAGSYIMFHWVRGIPFDFNSGAYDNLNMWEQIDNEQQFTPTKKYLLSVPIVLFLVSTHYTHYAIGLFSLNLLATIAVVIPKLPALHRLRTTFLSGPPEDR